MIRCLGTLAEIEGVQIGEAERIGMKPLMGVLLLAAAGVVGAQEENPLQGRTNVAASFEETSGAKASLLGTNGEASEAPSFAVAAAGREASAEPAGAAAAAAPAAKPRFVFGSRDDYRWQLGVGVEYLRFVSSRYDASLWG